MRNLWRFGICSCAALVVVGSLVSTRPATTRADDADAPAADAAQLAVDHPECVFFKGDQERFIDVTARPGHRRGSNLSTLTNLVVNRLSSIGGVSAHAVTKSYAKDSLDSYIFADLQANNITPAPATTDWEFVRR